MTTVLTTVGYQARAQHELVRMLFEQDIDRLVDVRIRAQSRKPGFSKTALRNGLAEADIAYEHIRELGTPLDIRALFRAGDTEEGRRLYREYLLAEARTELDYLAALCGRERIAILCFEFDERVCHRMVIAEELQRLHGIPAEHLR